MTDFATLETAISDWTARTDLGSKIPQIILIAEAKINRKVRILENEVDLEITTDADGDVLLPTGFLGFTSIEIKDAPSPGGVEFAPPDQLRKLKVRPQEGGAQVSYTLEAGKLKTSSNSSMIFATTFFQKFVGLNALTTTNALIIDHFDLYLWACMEATYAYLIEDDTNLEKKFGLRFELAVEELHISDRRKRTSGGPLIRKVRRRVG